LEFSEKQKLGKQITAQGTLFWAIPKTLSKKSKIQQKS
jgi:hypothetical protein